MNYLLCLKIVVVSLEENMQNLHEPLPKWRTFLGECGQTVVRFVMDILNNEQVEQTWSV